MELTLQAVLGIPDPPIYGSAYAAGGVTVSNKPACPAHGIRFKINGYVEIGIKAGVTIPGIGSIDLLKLTIKGGAKIKIVKEYYSYSDTSKRRRWGGGWGRRRRHTWIAKFHPAGCDIVVYIKVTLQILLIRGWMLAEYYIKCKRWVLTVGVDYYEFWKFGFGGWVTFASFVILDKTR